MPTRKFLPLLLIFALTVVIAGAITYQTLQTLNQLELAQKKKAALTGETLVQAVRGMVRYGRDKRQRLEHVLTELKAGDKVLSATIALDPSMGSFVVSSDSGVKSGAALFGAPRFVVGHDTITWTKRFTLAQRGMGRGCGHRHGADRDVCKGWGSVVPGRYALQIVLPAGDIHDVRAHILYEGIIMIVFIIIAGLLGVVVVHVKRKKDQVQLKYALERQRNDSLESMQFIAGGLAHETKNPLGAVRGYAQLIHERSEDEKTREQSGIMLRELDRVTSKLQEFLSFAGKKEPHRVPTDVGALASDVVALFAEDFQRKGIDLVCESCAHEITASVDPSQVKELLINLFLNALDACSEGDRVSIRTKVAGKGARITVKDTGPGIPPEMLGTVAKPYFTTKPEGSGLGLAICKRIAEDHNALFVLESEEGEGTEVTISFVG